MKKSPHVIWVSPTSRLFFRSKGEVLCRPGSVIPKLVENGIKLDVLIPYDPTLLPKTKLAPSRTTRHTVKLSQDYPITIIKLTRGSISPGIYMATLPQAEPAISSALYSKAAMALAQQLKRPVDIFHLFDWEVALLPLFLELEKSGNRLFKNTKTFLNVTTLREHGAFAPTVLKYLGIPSELFHPEGMEFFGRISFLKAGLLFADGVGLVEASIKPRNMAPRNGNGFEGILDAQTHKLRRWASDRSLRSHLEAYNELLSMAPATSILPRLFQKVQTGGDELKRIVESWGPIPPERYQTNGISFMVQSPTKAYAFWEWVQGGFVDYGLVLNDQLSKKKIFLARGLPALADYWMEVSPGREYILELVGFRKDGSFHSLLRSRPVRTPRNAPSANKKAIFIDVRTKQRFVKSATGEFENGVVQPGGTSALEWSTFDMPSSFREVVSSK